MNSLQQYGEDSSEDELDNEKEKTKRIFVTSTVEVEYKSRIKKTYSSLKDALSLPPQKNDRILVEEIVKEDITNYFSLPEDTKGVSNRPRQGPERPSGSSVHTPPVKAPFVFKPVKRTANPHESIQYTTIRQQDQLEDSSMRRMRDLSKVDDGAFANLGALAPSDAGERNNGIMQLAY